MATEWFHIGADPAPSKQTTLWSLKGPQAATARQVSERLTELAGTSDSVILGWDAPLSFDARYGFYDRPIDQAIRAFVAKEVKAGTIAEGAVAALAFAGCSHWAVTCHTIGSPFANGRSAWALCGKGYPEVPGRYVVEVHPAVALAFWWIQSRTTAPMPRYKKGGRGKTKVTASGALLRRTKLQTALKGVVPIPDDACATDDLLDAWVGWHLLNEFAVGRALPLGNPAEGAYLLPTSPNPADPVRHARVRVDALLESARTGLATESTGRNKQRPK